LKKEIDSGKKILIVDVREPHEYEIAHIEGARLVPLGKLAEKVNELDTSAEIVMQCHTGVRSARATEFLRGIGFKKVRNLEGGIDAWSTDVDASVPRY
jgi:adenylyltransferase/sulfurtransferase